MRGEGRGSGEVEVPGEMIGEEVPDSEEMGARMMIIGENLDNKEVGAWREEIGGEQGGGIMHAQKGTIERKHGHEGMGARMKVIEEV